PGLLGIHGLKTRKMGDMIWVEADLEMDGSLTIQEGHEIASEARKRVMLHEDVLDVMTHFDPVVVRPAPQSTAAENRPGVRPKNRRNEARKPEVEWQPQASATSVTVSPRSSRGKAGGSRARKRHRFMFMPVCRKNSRSRVRVD